MSDNTTERYWLRLSSLPSWQEATQEQFIQAERNAGFHPKCGTGRATHGFSGGGIEGRITRGEDPNEMTALPPQSAAATT